jgi:hypothetical protein
MIIVRNLVPIAGNKIVASVDVICADPPWRFVFRRCRWRLDEQGERLELPCGPFEFIDPDNALKWQRLGLHAAREQLALLPSTPRNRR